MWPYWLMFLLPTLAAFLTRQHKANTVTGLRSLRLDGAWIAVFALLTLVIGYRFEVGGDWGNYFNYLDDIQGRGWLDVLTMRDPGYQLLNHISVTMDWNIYGVNLIGGAIFSMGLTMFCLSLPRPWLGLAVAVPYVVIVVAMGYSRQGIALGFAMLALVALGHKSTLWYVAWVFLGATFHSSAILLLPIAALATTRNRYWTAVWITVVVLGAYWLMLEEAVERFYINYIETEYQSQGAMIRLTMNALPAVILLIWRRRFRFTKAETLLWWWFSIISIFLFAILLVSPSSTAVDRIALYMLPLQLVVFCHLPDALGKQRKRKYELMAAVLAYYGIVQFVWLNFAIHSRYWLPYRFYPFEVWF